MDLMGPFARRVLGSSLFAAASLIAGCRVDGQRGHAFTRESTFQPQGIDPWRVEVPRRASARGGTSAEREETATLVALTRSIVEAQRATAELALTRMSSEPLREHAEVVAHEAEENLEALRALAEARDLDVAGAAQSDDPVFVAQREVAARELAQLRASSGAAFTRTWLAGEHERLELLASLASLGLRLSPDVFAGNVFRMIAHDARTRADRTTTLAQTLPAG